MSRIVTFLVSSFVLMSCFGMFDSSSDKIIGSYKVLWIDLKENQFICEESEQSSTSCFALIPEYVFAVGHDENFIIAKQHPTSGFESGYKIDCSVTNYFIINMKKQNGEEDRVIGQLTKAQFDRIREDLAIEEIEFDLTYQDIP